MSHCSFFRPAVRLITVLDTRQIIRVPACRCLLSEETVLRLRTNENGRELASALTAANKEDGQPTLGPDLNMIASAQCTSTRLDTKCRANFTTLMNLFDLETALPAENELKAA